MTVNPIFYARSKHIELDYHFVREKVAMGYLITRYVSTKSQLADIFTKPFMVFNLILVEALFQPIRCEMKFNNV